MPSTSVLFTIGAVLAALWGLWRFLPVWRSGDKIVRLCEWPSWRLVYHDQKLKREIEGALKLPPRPRLEALEALVRKRRPGGLARWTLATELVATGIPEVLPRVESMLEGWGNGRSVVNGVRVAVERGEATEEYRVRAFQMLVPWLDAAGVSLRSGWDALPAVLLQLDADWALPILTSPEVLTPSHPAFRHVLKALREHGHAVPPDKVGVWVGMMNPMTDDSQEASAYFELLQDLVALDRPEAERRLLELTRQPHGYFATQSAGMLLELRGLDHPRDQILSTVEEEGERALTPVQHTAWLADMCYEYPVSCCGIEHYFEREEANRWKEASEALDQIGAKDHASRLREAAGIFGPQGPAAGIDIRMEQLAAMSPPLPVQVEELSRNYPNLRDDVFLKVLVYLLENEADQPAAES